MNVNTEKVKQVVADLEQVIELLPDEDKSFATDLVFGKWGFKKMGSLTTKQFIWAEKLLDRALTGDKPKEPAVTCDGFLGLVEFIKGAVQHLKYPKIKVTFEDVTVAVGLAGPNSKNAGKLNVTDGEAYGSNKFYGLISQEGVFEPRTRYEEIDDVTKILIALTDDPAAVAKEYGEHSGNCCFCHSKLTDKRSTDRGYGPTCAGHWNLPWGDEK